MRGRYSFPWIAPLPLVRTLYCWVLSKGVSSTIFKVFRMTRPGIEARSLGPLTNTLTTWPMVQIPVRVFANGLEDLDSIPGWVQSQVELWQRLKKWYLMSRCLTLSIIRYGSRVVEQSKERSSALPYTSV